MVSQTYSNVKIYQQDIIILLYVFCKPLRGKIDSELEACVLKLLSYCVYLHRIFLPGIQDSNKNRSDLLHQRNKFFLLGTEVCKNPIWQKCGNGMGAIMSDNTCYMTQQQTARHSTSWHRNKTIHDAALQDTSRRLKLTRKLMAWHDTTWHVRHIIPQHDDMTWHETARHLRTP